MQEIKESSNTCYGICINEKLTELLTGVTRLDNKFQRSPTGLGVKKKGNRGGEGWEKKENRGKEGTPHRTVPETSPPISHVEL